MAAYAALVSLTHILNQILHPPPSHHIIIPRKQIESLRQKLGFFIDFLETHSSRSSQGIEDLEAMIANAAHAAEDMIESDLVTQIREKYAIHRAKGSGGSCVRIQGIKKFNSMVRKLGSRRYKSEIRRVIKELDCIKKELVKVRETKKVMEDVNSITRASFTSGRNTMVGFDEQLLQVMSLLITHEKNRRIVPIVGMGGIGKTTLATGVFNHRTVKEHFTIRAWVNISQIYSVREVLLGLLHHIMNNTYANEQKRSDDEVGDTVYKELFGRKYLIVMDDMWDIQAWFKIKTFLPPNTNGSRILITTRLSNLAVDFGPCSPYEMSFLDDEGSWDLLQENVFAEAGDCPIELEEIGKSVAKRCGGLPLALVVIGGLLANSQRTKHHWESVEEDVTSAISHGNDDSFMKILSLSYAHLPVYLKPCFLYLSVFPANFKIKVSKLVRLWVAEGFIKASRDKNLEEIAYEYVVDLVNRNLVLICERGSCGKLKSCSIHHLIWDLCRKEAHKQNFLYIAKLDDPNSERERRISIQPSTRELEMCDPLLSVPLNRSLLSNFYWESKCITRKCSLLRVLDVVDFYAIEDLLQLTNSRYVACTVDFSLRNSSLWSSVSWIWNLQTLVVYGEVSLPFEIWQMPQLRHLKMEKIIFRDPPTAQRDDQKVRVLANLQTLSKVLNFRCTSQVLERIPNLRKLRIAYGNRIKKSFESHCLSNLVHLHKLESLGIRGDEKLGGNINFPSSLQKLTLENCFIPWEDMSMVGLLPNLEALKLLTKAAKGREWNPIEGEFRRLKFLLIHGCELEIWRAEHVHFPCLEQLHLRRLMLKTIPIGFAGILSLQVIGLRYCSSSLQTSAEDISEERESFGYEALQLRLNPSEISLSQDNVVGFEDEADTVIKYLNEESKELEVTSIIGMPGLGKTTLAWKIYRDPRIQYKFPTLIWVNVSQELNMRNVFLTILKKFTQLDMSGFTELELAQKVRSYLDRQKFLLFMDDVWTIEAWKSIERALPERNRLGRVVITSRNEKVAWQANHLREPHRLRFQDSTESWELLQLKVFGKLNECPSELEELGSIIAEQCDGVPLAIVVMAGLLVEMKNEWDKISTSLSSYFKYDTVTENIIAVSYNYLPHYLRDCFLYLGMFPENTEIPTWKLIRLWIAEGFIHRKAGKSLEEVAEENLKDLIKRNLVMVDKIKARGEVKTCRVHDMIREFCKNEAAITKQNLFQEVEKSREGVFHPSISEIRKHRRLCIHSCLVDFLRKKPKGPWVRSFLCFSKESVILPPECAPSIPDAFNLLRVLDVNPIKFTIFPTKLAQLTHLRYMALSGDNLKTLPKAVSELWNLQTIRIDTMSPTFEIEADIWNMMELRHLKTKAAIILNRELGKGEGGEKLQTLSRISAECCTEDLFDRASNLKNLGIRGRLAALSDTKCLEKLVGLQKLKLVHEVAQPRPRPLPRLPRRFPPNVRILQLSSTHLDWNHMGTLGTMPALEVLKLKDNAFMGMAWKADGGGFPCLEFLHIGSTDLEIWTAANDDAFPKLKCVVLRKCERLVEIPSSVLDNLQRLDIEGVTTSLLDSAREKQERMQLQGQLRAKSPGFTLILASPDESTLPNLRGKMQV